MDKPKKKRKMAARKLKVLEDAYKIAIASADMTKADFQTNSRRLRSVKGMRGMEEQYSRYEKLTSEALARALDAIKIEGDLADQLGPEYVNKYRPAKSGVNEDEEKGEDKEVRADKVESEKLRAQSMLEAHSTGGIAEAAGYGATALGNGFKFGRTGDGVGFVLAEYASYEKVGFVEGGKYKDIDFSRLLDDDNARVGNRKDTVLPMPEYERYASPQENTGAQQIGYRAEYGDPGSNEAEYRAQNTGYSAENAGYGTENAGYGTEHAGYYTEHAGYEHADYEHAGYEHASYEHAGYEHAGYGTENAGYCPEHAGYGTEHVSYGSENADYSTHEVGYGNEAAQHVNYGTIGVGNELQFDDDLTEEKLDEILAGTNFSFSEVLPANTTPDESYQGMLPANIIPYESNQSTLPNFGSLF